MVENVKEAIKEIYGIEEVSEASVAAFWSVLSDLSDREERIFRLYYGLDDGHRRDLLEISKEFGVTRERIRQILSKGIKKLYHPTRMRRVTCGDSGVKVNDPNKIYDRLEDADLSPRSYNCLKRANINTFNDILNLSIKDLIAIKSLGKKNFQETLAFVGENIFRIKKDY